MKPGLRSLRIIAGMVTLRMGREIPDLRMELNNGGPEGLNRRIKTITRTACGWRKLDRSTITHIFLRRILLRSKPSHRA
jgi:hypothetical protein